MLLTRKHEKAIDSVVAELKQDKREITQANIASFTMTQVLRGTHLAGSVGRLTPGMISEYCRKHDIPGK